MCDKIGQYFSDSLLNLFILKVNKRIKLAVFDVIEIDVRILYAFIKYISITSFGHFVFIRKIAGTDNLPSV